MVKYGEMKALLYLLFGFIIPLGFFGVYPDDDGRDAELLTFTIHLEDEKQTIDGFGASDAWSLQYVGKDWPIEKRTRIADLLFSTGFDTEGNPEGIGLSVWRFYIGAGSAQQGEESGINDPWRRAESFLSPTDSTYNWRNQEGQQWFMRAAHERGVDQFIGFAKSPPVLLTKNGRAYGDGGGSANLDPENVRPFAEYLTRIAQYFEQEGMPFDHISPVNEPQWDWSAGNGQEGSPFQNQEIAHVVAKLDQAIQSSDLDAEILIPETAQLDYLYGGDLPDRSHQIEYFYGSDSNLGEASALVATVAAHSYFTTWPVDKMIEQRRSVRNQLQRTAPDLKYWMTEYCLLEDNEEARGPGRDLGIDPALYLARVIHFDLTITNASSWQWWLAVSPYDYKDGLVYIDDDFKDGEVYESKLLWGMGNYSRFVRPGAVRVRVERSDNKGPERAGNDVMVSAYRNEDQLSAVMINYTREPRTVKIDVNGDDQESARIFTPYVTSSDADLERGADVRRDDKLKLPPRSIVTVVSSVGG